MKAKKRAENKIKSIGVEYKGRRTKSAKPPKVAYWAGSPSLKGQFFIIAGIFIIVALVLLKNLLSVYATIEEKRFQESLVTDKQLKNIRDEYRYIIGIASEKANPNASAINFTYNFSGFLRDEQDIKMLYLVAYVNATTKNYSVTVGNFLGDRVNVTINATDSTPAGYLAGIVNDRTNITRQFNTSFSGFVNITLTYNRENINYTEVFSLDTRVHTLLGFFDLQLSDKDISIRSKSTYNTTMNRTR